MKILKNIALITFTVSFMVIMISTILSKKLFIDPEKSSAFECGFDPMSSARIPFTLHFFLIPMINLIFDVDITLPLPLVLTMNMTSIQTFTMITFMFILILLIGLYYEWKSGALNWAI
nr:NADH dehydrogenase subunit 3 [Sclerotia substriata]